MTPSKTVFLILGSLISAVLFGCAASETSMPIVEYRGAKVFDGTVFVERSICTAGAMIVSCPKTPNAIVETAGGYITPPFADTHNHHFDTVKKLERIIPQYIADGVFYARSLTNKASIRNDEEIQALINKPQSIDVAFSHGGVTGTSGHPIYIYEAIELGIINNFQSMSKRANELNKSRLAENDAYYIVDTLADLEEKWPLILATEPDIIKTYLVDSARHKEDQSDRYLFGWRGLDPVLLPELVNKAHEAGIRVTAHVTTRADYIAAIGAGVDELAHLPGAGALPGMNISELAITAEDARLAGARGVIVTPTANLSVNFQDADALKEIMKNNLALLKEAGVKIAVGSDYFLKSPIIEAEFLHSLDVFTAAEIIYAWTTVSANAIFPDRNVGCLQPGCEASFLVLEGNPLQDFEHIKDIQLRVKEGFVLEPPPSHK